MARYAQLGTGFLINGYMYGRCQWVSWGSVTTIQG